MTDALRDRVAILGWGSLIWDLDDLAPKVRGPWAMGAGPRLALEFSRISPKRLMSLVVVLDPDHGEVRPTHAVASLRGDVDAAAEDLRARERAPSTDFIGLADAATGRSRSSHPAIGPAALDWCRATGARGAVWTDLPRNFEAETGRPFSIAAGLAHLRALPEAGLAEAVRYVDGAPAETDTPLRRALDADPWWRGLPRQSSASAR